MFNDFIWILFLVAPPAQESAEAEEPMETTDTTPPTSESAAEPSESTAALSESTAAPSEPAAVEPPSADTPADGGVPAETETSAN